MKRRFDKKSVEQQFLVSICKYLKCHRQIISFIHLNEDDRHCCAMLTCHIPYNSKYTARGKHEEMFSVVAQASYAVLLLSTCFSKFQSLFVVVPLIWQPITSSVHSDLRWMQVLLLQGFSIQKGHIRGADNVVADALSRWWDDLFLCTAYQCVGDTVCKYDYGNE